MKTGRFLLLLSVLSVQVAAQATLSKQAAKTEQELQALHDAIRTASVAHDRVTLEGLYADGYVFIHTTGEMDRKADWITKSLTIAAPPQVPVQDPVFFDVVKDVAVRTSKANLSNGSSIWWTRVYVKRKGHWLLLREHGSAVPAPRKVATVSTAILDQYAGTYKFDNGVTITVERRGEVLIAHNPARPEVQLIAESETEFHVPGGGAVYTFYKDENGKVTHFVLKRASGEEFRASKLN